MKQFIHKKSEVVDGYQVPQTQTQIDNKEIPQIIDKYVPGYGVCSTCGVHPSFSYDSKRPDQVIVITCDHITGAKP